MIIKYKGNETEHKTYVFYSETLIYYIKVVQICTIRLREIHATFRL